MAESLAEIPVDDYRLTIERSERGSVIRLLDAEGGVPLRVELGPGGPVLVLGSGLTIAVAGELAFDAQRVAIHGREGIHLRSGGNTTIESEGDLVTRAREQIVEARLGDVRIKANDDVKVNGERIRLNC
jgi:hypothetical protein